ncbi:hypothetical protein [Thalassococcus lentus]|uniref:Uncharacterized protein n=1 Tax=Thalassococcus lentus TaxID=1210524 RepID=A0ABT4XQ31_9RHOB|nr:hypothetical protein [Thalassococcus lentus]MDA7424059.1 hypothetical protein [Thalassococcus lentus]
MMFLPGSKGFFRVGPIALLLALVAAVFYLVRVGNIAPERSTQEAFFVGTLIANSAAALFLAGALGRQVGGFFEMMSPGSGGPVLDRIFNQRGNLVIAAILTLLIAGSVWSIAPWSAEAYAKPGLDGPLVILLLLVNVPIGLAVGALVHYWWEAYRAWTGEDLRIFPLPRKKLVRYTMINTTTTVTAAVIACSTFLGLRVSVLQPDLAIIVFSVVSLMLVGATYVVPLFSLSTRLHLSKHDLLGEIEEELAHCFQAQHADDLQGKGDQVQSRVDGLLAYRETVRNMSTFPPNGEYSFTTAAGVVILALLPAFIDYILSQGL